MLRCHPNTVRAWIRKGKLEPIFMGEEKVPMLPRKDVLRLRKPLETAGVLARDVHHAFPVVGIGASAGGTDAVTELLKGIPSDLGLGYVFVSHLEQGREGTLAELLRKRTAMPVLIAENGMRLQPDRFYVGPAGMHLAIVNGTFTLSRPRGKRSAVRPIDAFFTAIAEEYQNNAIGIVLSGTGSDGTEGLAAIRAQDGLTIVQDGSAREAGMPLSATDAGVVDLVQEPGAMGRTLVQLVKQLYPGGKARIPGKHENEMRRILRYVEEQRGVDFSQYKEKTIQRRIIRRMILSQCADLGAYSVHLRGTPSEVDVLCSDLLINVSAFFRDPDFYKALRLKILPALLKDRTANAPLRIWVAGCAGGEEVVSIAITVIEYQQEHQLAVPVQIFATDLNERNIEKARLGVYKKSALRDIGDDRLQRFFMYVDDHFQVIKAIRDMCVFARHDLLKDPPFSRVDLISCQNVLIYLDNAVQARVLKSFHYALRQDGVLCLGRSETTGDASELFSHPEREQRYYRKKPKKLGRLDLDVHFKPPAPVPGVLGMVPTSRTATEVSADLEAVVEKLLQEHMPPSLLVNQDLEIVRFRGNVAPFLGPTTGKASLHLLKMVRDDLSFELRMLLNRARKDGKAVRKGPIPMRQGEALVDARMEVQPLGEGPDRHYLVLFKEDGPSAQVAPGKDRKGKTRAVGDARDRRIAQLEKELYDAREQVRLVSEESEQATQELQSANEEVVSSNEELQSINEELETSKEELQSVNEEFATINEELQARNDELRDSEERLRLAARTGKVGIWDLDVANDRITWTQSLYEIHGMEPGTGLTRERFLGLLHTDDRAGVQQAMDQALRTGKRYEQEFRAMRPDGRVIWLYSHASVVRADGRSVRMLGATIDITDRKVAEQRLVERTRSLELMNSVGQGLIAELDVERIVQAVTDAGREISGAAFGAFFYNVINEKGDSYTLYTISGVPREAFSKFPMPRATELFGPTFRGEGIVRSDDITKDPRYGRMAPHHGMPKGHLPVRSYLAVPVTARDGRVLGGLFYGHPDAGRFSAATEEPMAALAGQAALALDNADLHRRLQLELEQQRAAKLALEESETRYGQLIRTLPVAVFTCDNDGRVLLFNDSAVELWGREPDKDGALWHGALKLYSIEGTLLSAEASPMARAVREGKPIRGEMVIVERPDGTRRRVLAHPEPIRDAAGNVIGGHNVLVDITDRMANEQRLEIASRVGKLGIWDWDLSSDSIIWTDAVYPIHGVDQGSFTPDIAGYTRLVHPDDRERVGAAIREALEGGAPYDIEFRTLATDGKVHWVYTNAVVVREGDRPVRMIGATMSITERKRAEEALSASEERFRLLADNMDQLAWMADPTGQTMWFNRQWEAFSGIPVDQIRERAKDEMHHPDHYDRVTGSLRAAAERGEAWEDTFPLKSKDGQWHWFLSRVMPVKDTEGRVQRWFGTSTDITGLREAQERIVESEERFRLLGDSMAQLAWIGDENGKAIWFNKQWVEFTGVDLLDRPVEERGRIIHHPDHIDRVRSSHDRGVKTGRTWEETFPMRRKDGQYRWFLSRSVPVRDAEGRITRWFGTNTDITEARAAQEQLREREERLTMAADAANLGIFEMDLDDGTMLWENERMYAIFGRTKEQGPLDRRGLFGDVLHPDDRASTTEVLECAIASERDLRCKCRVLNEALGEHRTVEVAARVEHDEEGRAWRLVGVIADISDRERTVQAAGRLAAIVENSDDAVMGMDLEGNITDWNLGAERMYGYGAGEIIGQHVGILLPPDREDEEPAIIARIRRGEYVQHYETVRKRKDGTLIEVSLSISPIRDDQRAITGISKIARDVTEERAMAREIERATEQLRLVADHMPVAVTRCSKDLRYVWVSKGYLDWIGLEQSAVDGKPIRDVLGPKAFETIRPYLQRVMAGERVEYEARLEPTSRPPCWINATYVPVRDPETGQDGWIAVITDITRRKELEAALQDADRHKDHFLATLAHELRGPLAPLKNGLSLLEMAAGDKEMIESTRGMMERQMDHLVRLVDDLMDLNRISRGKIQLKREKTALAEVLATATEANRPAMEQAGHTLDLRLETDEVVVDGDPARLTQVFVNLLHNATKYTPSGGRIVLRLERDTRANKAVITVTDNGIGIEPEALSHVFEMFAQTDKAQKIQAGGGLGIGLNIVQRLVQMHGGSVSAQSEGDGKGSTFTVRLPIDTASPLPGGDKPSGKTGASPTEGKRRILVVDDNDDASLTMSMILKKLGNEVRTAGDGAQALQTGEAFRPDIVFMDIGMPQMDGYEACRRMRTTDWGKDITIIALSGWGQEEDRRLSMEAGFDRHVVKPIDGSTLRGILKELE